MSKFVKEFRTMILQTKKQIAFKKHMLKTAIKTHKGEGFFDVKQEINYPEAKKNFEILSFNTESDLSLLEEFSDSVEYGGETYIEMMVTGEGKQQQKTNEHGEIIEKEEENYSEPPRCLHIKGEMKHESHGLAAIKTLFGGVQTTVLQLFQNEFNYCNGISITCKSSTPHLTLGLLITQEFATYPRWYSGHIYDISTELQRYELPIGNFKAPFPLMSTSPSSFGHQIFIMGVRLFTQHNSPSPVDFYVQSVSVINNDEFGEIEEVYKYPFFFKEKKSYLEETYLDTGINLYNMKTAKGRLDRKVKESSWTQENF